MRDKGGGAWEHWVSCPYQETEAQRGSFLRSILSRLLSQAVSCGCQDEGKGGALQEICVQSLGQEDSLEKGMATHSSILAWRTPMDRGAWQARVLGIAKSWS